MKTQFLSAEKAISERSWVVMDAEDQVVGRFASEIASALRGKNKATFTPHNDCGDFVIVINASKLRFTGHKAEQKYYRHHTGYIGSLKEERADKLLARNPEELLRLAVRGMLPKTALGKRQLKKLKVYAGAEHPHSAQVLGSQNAAAEDTAKAAEKVQAA